MKVKTQKLMADLQDSDTKIGDAYTNGVVDGFSVQWGPWYQCQTGKPCLSC